MCKSIMDQHASKIHVQQNSFLEKHESKIDGVWKSISSSNSKPNSKNIAPE